MVIAFKLQGYLGGYFFCYNGNMELKEYILLLFKNIKKIIIVGIIGLSLGIVSYYVIPPKYVATASFVVVRSADSPTQEYFNYEGYYAQQASLTYAKTFAALLESVDVREKTLVSLGLEVTERNLRNLKRYTHVKNDSHLVTLEVRSLSASDAAAIWTALSTASLDTVQPILQNSDSALSVVQVSEVPIIHQSFNNIYLSATVGFLFGVLVSIVVISLSDYLGWGKSSKKRKK